MSIAVSLPEVCGGGGNGCLSTAGPDSEASEGGACEVSQFKGFLQQPTANGGSQHWLQSLTVMPQ